MLPWKQTNKQNPPNSLLDKTRKFFGFLFPLLTLHVQCGSARGFPLCPHCTYSPPRLNGKLDVTVTERKESSTGLVVANKYSNPKVTHTLLVFKFIGQRKPHGHI